MPKVTVLMTVYNGLPYLHSAIQSILKQTFEDFEFLIINDCSTDDSRQVILDFRDRRIRLLENEKNLKQTRSLNRGLAETRTDLVARMDADDISHPKRLERQVDYLKSHPGVVAVGTHLRFINSRGEVTGNFEFPEQDLVLRWMQLFDCPVSCGAVMFKKSVVWDKLGGFDPSIRYAQDWELWSRVLPLYQIANVPEKLVDVRQHSAASSISAFAPMLEEQRKINRLNPERILGMAESSMEWFSKLDTLLDKRLSHPEKRLEVIGTLFQRFCDRYQGAEKNLEINQILARQYLEVLYYSDIRRWGTVLRTLRTVMSHAPMLRRVFWQECRSQATKIPGHFKYWAGRHILGLNI